MYKKKRIDKEKNSKIGTEYTTLVYVFSIKGSCKAAGTVLIVGSIIYLIASFLFFVWLGIFYPLYYFIFFTITRIIIHPIMWVCLYILFFYRLLVLCCICISLLNIWLVIDNFRTDIFFVIHFFAVFCYVMIVTIFYNIYTNKVEAHTLFFLYFCTTTRVFFYYYIPILSLSQHLSSRNVYYVFFCSLLLTLMLFILLVFHYCVWNLLYNLFTIGFSYWPYDSYWAFVLVVDKEH